MSAYLPRTIDGQLDELMDGLAAIALEGPRGVGKTATAARRARTVLDLDLDEVRAGVIADLASIRRRDGTLLIDEWQRHPAVWDVVRREVDRGAPPGSFLLAGSAYPVGASIHSGAGRIVSLRMRPLAWSERGLSGATVSLGALLAGGRPDVSGASDVDVTGYVEEILRSGLPGLRPLPRPSREQALESYVDRIAERELPEMGVQVRRADTLRRWMRSYAAATSTTASYNAILDAATPGESDKPAKTTTIAYRDALTSLWVLDPVPGWAPSRNRLERLTQAPKHHLADPALAAVLLGVDADALLDPVRRVRDGRLVGQLFESLVTLEVRVAAQAQRARVSHLRTREGRHEVDLVLERRDGRIVAIEIKLGGAVDDADVRHLRWLAGELGDDLLDAVMVTTGPYAYRRQDGIAVVPAALLGP